MRAVKIDPVNRTVTEIDLKKIPTAPLMNSMKSSDATL